MPTATASTESSFEIVYKLTYNEMLRAMIHSWIASFRYPRYAAYGILFICAAVWAPIETIFANVLLALGSLYILSPLWWCPLTVWRQTYADRDKGPVRMRIEGDRLRIAQDEGTSETFLGELEKVRESKMSLILYIDSTIYLIVPKRVFDDEERMKEFTSFAEGLVQT